MLGYAVGPAACAPDRLCEPSRGSRPASSMLVLAGTVTARNEHSAGRYGVKNRGGWRYQPPATKLPQRRQLRMLGHILHTFCIHLLPLQRSKRGVTTSVL
jgi:hypothetical protein